MFFIETILPYFGIRSIEPASNYLGLIFFSVKGCWQNIVEDHCFYCAIVKAELKPLIVPELK